MRRVAARPGTWGARVGCRHGEAGAVAEDDAPWILKLKFTVGGRPDAFDGLPRVMGEDLAPALVPLEPTDILLLGNSGGTVARRGARRRRGGSSTRWPTEKTMRGWWGSVWDTLWRPFRREPHLA